MPYIDQNGLTWTRSDDRLLIVCEDGRKVLGNAEMTDEYLVSVAYLPLPKTEADRIARACLDGMAASREERARTEARLEGLRARSTILDTSQLRPAQLRAWVRDLVRASGSSLTLVFESFAFKQGVPMDADFVFDVRMLPNPFYIKELKPLTGRDEPVIDYLAQQPESAELIAQIEAFLLRWLPALEGDQRSYVTVAIGCTGGQHRSVYCVEQLTQRFSPRGVVLSRHRELDAK